MFADTPSSRTCSECGSPLLSGESSGCPSCLLRLGLFESGAGGEPLTELEAIAGDEFNAVQAAEGRFGRYRLHEVIGRGGMGIVYRAWQEDLGREVAVKVLPGGPLATLMSVERLRAEAAMLGRLRHPGIVMVHEVGVANGQVFVAMELIRGGNLAEAVKEQPLPPRLAADYVEQVATAIQHAHEAGIWHRDLKPANILVDEDGRARVTDFGLAKLTDAQAELTLSGQFLGTLGYLAPEQADGSIAPVGPRTDVYAMGALLYHLLTGRPVFMAATTSETFRQTLECEPVSPRLLNQAVPVDLQTICLKCLAKDPDGRYATAADVAADIRNYLKDRPIVARPLGRLARLWRWRRRNPVLAAMALGLAVVGLTSIGVVSSLWQKAEREIRRTEEALTQLRRDRVSEMFASDQPLLALSLLGDLLREMPGDRLAAERARAALTWLSHPLPEHIFYGNDAAAIMAVFDPEETAVLSASRDGTARVWSLVAPSRAPAVLAHSAPLAVALFSPDGQKILTAGEDGMAKLWRRTDFSLEQEWNHPGPVLAAAFSPDGGRVATACEDGRARVLTVGKTVPAIELPHAEQVLVVRFDASGERIVTGSRDATGRVWDARTGAPLSPPLEHEQRVVDAAFSLNGERLATSSWDGSVKVWAADNWRLVAEGAHDNSWVNSLAFSPDGRRVLSGGQSSLVNLWTIGEQEPERSWKHTQAVYATAFSPDGEALLTASLDGSVRVMRTESGEAITLPLIHRSSVWSAVFSRDGSRVLTGSEDGTVTVWNVLPGAARPEVMKHPLIFGAQWSGDGARVLTHGDDRMARLWDAETGREAIEAKTIPAQLVHASLSRDGNHIFATGRDGGTRVWNVRDGTEREFLPRHRRGMWTAAFSSDSRYLVTASWDDTARLWSVETGEPLGEAFTHAAPISAVAFDPASRRVATGSRDGILKVWTVPEARPVVEFAAHKGDVVSMDFSLDGRWMVTVSTDRSARIWDADGDWGLVWTLGHENEVNQARFSPDGRHVATASKDRTARIWETATGRPVGLPLIHGGLVNTLNFSPDGKRLATGASDGFVRIWDGETGYPLGALRLDEGREAVAVEFRADGKRLLTASRRGEAALWPMPPVSLPVPDWFIGLIETLTLSVPKGPVSADVSVPGIVALRTTLPAGGPEDDWSAWADWFFADRSRRAPAPIVDAHP